MLRYPPNFIIIKSRKKKEVDERGTREGAGVGVGHVLLKHDSVWNFREPVLIFKIVLENLPRQPYAERVVIIHP